MTSAHPEGAGRPEAPVQGIVMKALTALGLILLALLPLGSLGLMVAGLVGWFLWSEVADLPAILLATALFLMVYTGGPAARAWTALRWGGAASLAAALLLVPFTAADGTVARNMAPLTSLAQIANLIWLALLALVAWRPVRLPEKAQGPMLALAVLTSPLVAYPALAIQMLVVGLVTEPVQGIVLAPIILAGIAIGMAAVLLLGAVLARGAGVAGRWVRPQRVIGILAAIALLLRLWTAVAA